jgi:hypothetical protein
VLVCYPAHLGYTRIRELFRAAAGRHGADLLIGRRLAELYRQAGLRDIGVEARAGVYRAGDSRRMVGPDLARSMHPVIVSLGLADQQELDQLDRAVRADPRTLVMPHLSSSGAANRELSSHKHRSQHASSLTVIHAEPAISRANLNTGRTI